MTVRNTSKAAYLANEQSGMHSTKRTKRFEYIFQNPGCTRSEIMRSIPGMTINCVTPRVNELLALNHIHECGCKHDVLTKRSVNRLYKGRKPECAA